MKAVTLQRLAAEMDAWHPPALPEEIPHGDMPGDRVQISADHIRKAQLIFPPLVRLAAQAAGTSGKVVIGICGGSGVGKSGTAALLCHYFRTSGVGAYTLSGDNYPHRIPLYNDAERMRIFRTGGIRGMMKAGVYTEARGRELRGLWQRDEDAAPESARNRPWLAAYQAAGRAALAEYLGTDREQDYEELSGIAARFHRGESKIWLKRMGRTEDALWYDQVDFSRVQVLLIEWTHSSNDRLRGVDLPVLLNSTPEETRLYRRARNRDGRVDSPFTTMVLEIEQKELHRSAHKAGLILSKDGKLLSYEEYCALMNDQL